ncbi:MAG: hypothetical protein WCI74_17400, partial [Actinomycetes bacterium]
MTSVVRAHGLRIALVVAVCSLTFFAFVLPSGAATTAQPALAPATLMTDTFETTPDTNVTVAPRTSWNNVLSTSYWAPFAGRGIGGSVGSWCAGSLPASWAFYSNTTAGDILWSVPTLADYYSSNLGMAYIMPSAATRDISVSSSRAAFNVRWNATGDVSHVATVLPLRTLADRVFSSPLSQRAQQGAISETDFWLEIERELDLARVGLTGQTFQAEFFAGDFLDEDLL